MSSGVCMPICTIGMYIAILVEHMSIACTQAMCVEGFEEDFL